MDRIKPVTVVVVAFSLVVAALALDRIVTASSTSTIVVPSGPDTTVEPSESSDATSDPSVPSDSADPSKPDQQAASTGPPEPSDSSDPDPQVESTAPFEWTVDESLADHQLELPGIGGGPGRVTVSQVGPGGNETLLVGGEVVVSAPGQDDPVVRDLLERYDGQILQADEYEDQSWFLVSVDVDASGTDDLSANMERLGFAGEHRFSSVDAARLAAIVVRHPELGLTANVIFEPGSTDEHPTADGGNLDADTAWWIADDLDPSTPEADGLSIGVDLAWEMTRRAGVTETDAGWDPQILAIIDSGFDLDGTTGAPVGGNDDWRLPIQIDLLDFDNQAGGIGVRAENGVAFAHHGTLVFGVAAAWADNRFGWAGTGGTVSRPMVMRTDTSGFNVAMGIHYAATLGADVVSLSVGWFCPVPDWMCSAISQNPTGQMQQAVYTARAFGAVVVVLAGNFSLDLDTRSGVMLPCDLVAVICVGAIDQNAQRQPYSDWGSAVDIWAPAGIYGTVLPQDAGKTGTDALFVFGGTSASTPFVAGIVAMMKAFNPDLDVDEVAQILHDTGNPSSDPLVDRYVDAARAVGFVAGMSPPEITIVRPLAGMVSPSAQPFHANVVDPDTEPRLGKVTWTSDRQGFLCQTNFDSSVTLACNGWLLELGDHVITAVADDGVGGVDQDQVAITVANTAPTVEIVRPGNDETFYSNQAIRFTARVTDPEEQIFEDSQLVWSSDIDGVFAGGYSPRAPLSAGLHVVTVAVTDEYGATTTATTSIVVQPGLGVPTLTVVEPRGFYAPGEAVPLRAQAIDPEDGILDDTIVWESNIDGVVATGSALDVVLSGPSTPCNPETVQHEVTVSVVDVDNHAVTYRFEVAVGRIC